MSRLILPATMTGLMLLSGNVLADTTTAAVNIAIDGRIDPDEWVGAREVDDFRVVAPLTRAAPSAPVHAWIKAVEQGLAIAMRVEMPAGVVASRQPVQRDFEAQVDRINVMLDFDGDGRTAYNFAVSSTNGIYDAVVTNENFFNTDWDGNWQHAVQSDANGWTTEILIPWSTATMRGGEDGQRTLRIYLDRVIGATGERAAWPAVSYEQAKFVSAFTPIQVQEFSQSLLAITPYAAVLHDNRSGHNDPDAGGDIFWKPSGRFQLAATVNPDFGQVESDDLVVNFSATETFVSDKRPFFTENQGLFEYTTPSDFSQLLYTRRVGGPADDGNGAGDITAAVKLNGDLAGTKYGLFHAEEADEAGRSFSALRLVRDFGEQNLGMMLTRVDRPWLDREASVLGFDHNWRPSARWNIRSRLFGSRISEHGEINTDVGGSIWADYEMDHGWRQQWIAMHFGNDLQINDAGYLSRNSLNYLHWQVNRRFTDLPAASRYSSKDWRWRITQANNNHGDLLERQLRISRRSQLRNGANEYAQVNFFSAGVDDLLTRGHGNVDVNAGFNAQYEYSRPRKGNWSYELTADAESGGLGGYGNPGWSLEFVPTYYIGDTFSVSLGAQVQRQPDWLVWQTDTLVGRFNQTLLQLDAGLNWNIDPRQELRVRLQAIGIDAPLRQAIRVAGDGSVYRVDDPVADIGVRNLGLQIRYRYELAPLSYLYLVYARGGYLQDEEAEGAERLLRDSFQLRDSDQLLLKLSYRFEM